MKIAKEIPAFLLGLVFVVFGLNFFFPFIPQPKTPMPENVTNYMTVMMGTGYLKVVKILEVAIGLLLLLPKTRALALILIAPIVVNILLFELLISQQPGIGIALIVINLLGIYFYRAKYKGIIS